VYNAAGTLQTALPHTVQGTTGTVAGGASTTVTLAGSAAFASATSYICTANANVANAGVVTEINVEQTSGTSVTFYNSNFSGFGSASATISYLCIGH
jgi:hypothetical protein